MQTQIPPATQLQSSPSALQLAEQLQNEFAIFAAAEPEAYCAIMLDPALRDACEDEEFLDAQTTTAHAKPFPRISWDHPNLRPEHRPYLIELQMTALSASTLLQASLKIALADQTLESLIQGGGNRICGWLFSCRPIEQLTRHLGRIAVQRLPSDQPSGAGKRLLLRYYDPSVMPTLWKISDQIQRRSLLGPILRFSIVNRSGQLESFEERDKAGVDGQSAVIGYSAKQWQNIQNIGALNRIGMEWQSTNGTDGAIAPAVSNVIFQALSRASQHGFTDYLDQKAYVWHALTTHPKFDLHTRVATALTLFQGSTRQSFTAAIDSFSERDWAQIKRELSLEPSIIPKAYQRRLSGEP